MKKHFFITFKKRTIILFLILLLVVCSFAFLPNVFASSPGGLLTVVVDAGHGGFDVK